MNDSDVTTDNRDNPSAMAARLRELRAKAGLTAVEVQERGGPHRNTVWNAEGGKHPPTLETLEALARVYGVPVTELLSDPTEEDTDGDD